VRLGRNKVPSVFPAGHKFEIGKGCEVVAGTDLTFITTGLMTAQAVIAAEKLGAEGISARVVHIGTIKPLDKELIVKAARETGAVITAEEHSVVGGLGGAVAELLGEECPTLMKRVGIYDRFGTSGKSDQLLKYFGLNAETLIEEGRELFSRKK
jgi:transketolase